MTDTQSALVVVVPEAEPVVGAWRAELDRAAGWGVPAHVTVLFPFLPPEQLDDDVRARIATAAASVSAFAVSFPRLAWFGDDVVYLEPDPGDGFRALTAAVMGAFPGVLPYAGEYGPDPTPHLTVGHDAPADRLTAAEHAIAPRLPVAAEVGAVSLLVGSPEPNGWSVAARFPLG